MLEKTTRINFLYDFYQSLLTDKQRNYMEMYYVEDLSLGEIAETFDVSRQAVYDNIHRTEKMLEDYEAKLELYRKFVTRRQIVEQLEMNIDKLNDEKLSNDLKMLKELE